MSVVVQALIPVFVLIVIEAGDLRKGAPLRKLVEASPAGAALPCYEDDERSIGAVIDTTLRDVGIAIERDARELLMSLLGSDRMATRAELEKLVLYAGNSKRIGYDDVIAAIADSSGLALDDVVGEEVQRIAKRHEVPLRAVSMKVEVEDPKAAIREFQTTALADTECFERTLARIETDVEVMRQRANAWATGDVQALQALPVESQYKACIDAFTGTALAQRLGAGDVRPRLQSMWLAAAEEALEADEVSLALLPVSLAITPDGYLARLRERGYEVEAP